VRTPAASQAERAKHEIEHGRRIRETIERIWGWSTPAGGVRADRRARLLIEHAHIEAPGGRFVFSEPNLRNPQVWLQKNVGWIKRLLGDSPDETAFRRGQLERTLKNHGLGEVSTTPFDWLHPWTPGAVIPLVGVLGSLLETTALIRELSGSLLIAAKK